MCQSLQENNHIYLLWPTLHLLFSMMKSWNGQRMTTAGSCTLCIALVTLTAPSSMPLYSTYTSTNSKEKTSVPNGFCFKIKCVLWIHCSHFHFELLLGFTQKLAFGMTLLRKRDVPKDKYSSAVLGFGLEESTFVVELIHSTSILYQRCNI